MNATDVTRADFAIETIGTEIDRMLSVDQRARWSLDRSRYSPRLYSATDASGTAGALVSHRHGTAYVKIVDVVSSSPALARGVVEAIICDASKDGMSCVKWETRTAAETELAEELGFEPLPAPIASGTGTESPASGYVLWIQRGAPLTFPYYRQSAGYTCGPVSSMIGASAFAPFLLDPEGSREKNHDIEMSIWRQATMSWACEAHGVAVTLRSSVLPDPEVGIELYSSTDRLSFERDFNPLRAQVRQQLSGDVLAWYDGEQEELRSRIHGLQLDFRRRTTELGIPVHRDPFTVDALVERLRAGDVALLCIAQTVMHPGNPGGHWVVAHSPHAGTIMIQDPWISADLGETWVDSSLLPVPESTVDAMWGLSGDGEPARYAILLSRHSSTRLLSCSMSTSL